MTTVIASIVVLVLIGILFVCFDYFLMGEFESENIVPVLLLILPILVITLLIGPLKKEVEDAVELNQEYTEQLAENSIQDAEVAEENEIFEPGMEPIPIFELTGQKVNALLSSNPEQESALDEDSSNLRMLLILAALCPATFLGVKFVKDGGLSVVADGVKYLASFKKKEEKSEQDEADCEHVANGSDIQSFLFRIGELRDWLKLEGLSASSVYKCLERIQTDLQYAVNRANENDEDMLDELSVSARFGQTYKNFVEKSVENYVRINRLGYSEEKVRVMSRTEEVMEEIAVLAESIRRYADEQICADADTELAAYAMKMKIDGVGSTTAAMKKKKEVALARQARFEEESSAIAYEW